MAEDGSDAASDLPTLEEFLVACQKSLARASGAAQQVARSDSEFAQGERPVYVIDGFDLELNVGMRLDPGAVPATADRVHLDFEAPTSQRSVLKFRVETRPQELLAGAKLQLANLDPLGEGHPAIRLRAWLVDDRGMPVPNYPLTLHFARAGDKRRRSREEIEVATDVVGRVDFFLETDKAERNLKVVGVRRRFTVHVRGSGRGRGADEFYVWVTCPRARDWASVVDPVAPRPPTEIERDEEGRTVILVSELLRLTLER